MKSLFFAITLSAQILVRGATDVSNSAVADQFTKITATKIVTDGGDSTGVAWGDYDGDGNLDLFVSNFGTPACFLYHNTGDGAFTRVTAGDITMNGANSEGAVWADYDNDGDLDLFVAVGLNGNDRLYQNKGDGSFYKNHRRRHRDQPWQLPRGAHGAITITTAISIFSSRTRAAKTIFFFVIRLDTNLRSNSGAI